MHNLTIYQMKSMEEMMTMGYSAKSPNPRYGSWRVRASVTIPTGITAGPYPSELMLGANTRDHPKGDKYIQVKVKDKTLVACPDMDAPLDWLLHMTPARDRHEQNVEATRDAGGRVAFRIIKDIQKGQELLVWYSAELAMECNIPILTPANISTDQDYVCTSCKTTFHYPNTLKAHVRFHCTRNPMTSWLGQYSTLQNSSLMSAYQLELSKYFQQLNTLWNLKAITATGAISPPTNFSHARPDAPMKSAFRPCQKSSASISPQRSSLAMSHQKSGGENGVKDLFKSSVPSGRHGNSSPVMSYARGMTSLPNYLDNMCVPNYDQFVRPGFPTSYPLDLSSSMHRVPLAASMNTSSVSPRSNSFLMRDAPGSTMGYRSKIIRQEENRSPDNEDHQQLQIPPVNFPMPSETAGEPIDMLPKSLYLSKSFKGHLCIYCGKLYSRKYGLKIHLRTHTGYKPLKCKICLRPFGDPSNLNKHIRLHAEGDTPYRCEHCGKVLVRRRDLERHIKSRHPQHSVSEPNDTDDASDALADADNSFIDVDISDDDENDTCDFPISITRQNISVSCSS